MAILFFHDEKFGTITGENKGVLCQQLSQMARGTAFKNVVSMYWGRFNKSSCWVLANKWRWPRTWKIKGKENMSYIPVGEQ